MQPSAPVAGQVVTMNPEGTHMVVQQPQPIVMQQGVPMQGVPMQGQVIMQNGVPMQVMGTEGGFVGQPQQMVVVQQQVVHQQVGHLCCGDTGNAAVDHMLKTREWCGSCGGCCDMKLEMIVWGSLMCLYGLLSMMFAYGDELAIIVGIFGLISGILYIIAGSKNIKEVAMLCIPLSPVLAIYNIYEAIVYFEYFAWLLILITYHLVAAGTFGYITVLTYNYWKAIKQI